VGLEPVRQREHQSVRITARSRMSYLGHGRLRNPRPIESDSTGFTWVIGINLLFLSGRGIDPLSEALVG